jgi:hypothetical protein
VDKRPLEEEMFALVGYMVTSARNLVDETPTYGPFRLVDAASRLIAILEEEGMASDRLELMRGKIDSGKYSVMTDQDEFTAFLDAIVGSLVDHADANTGGDAVTTKPETKVE